MLKHIPRIISTPALEVLHAMGHGDELLIADANFPKASIAAMTVYGEPVYISVPEVTIAIRAILQIFPLDTFVTEALAVMQAPQDSGLLPLHKELVQAVHEAAPEYRWKVELVERFAFYERAKKAYAVFHTADARPYGNIILKKGVLDNQGNLVFP